MMMPVSLISTGIGSLMLPTTAGWLHHVGPRVALRRLLLVAAALSVVTLGYAVVLWVFRDWIFTEILKKQFEHRDALLALWALAFWLMIVRDQLVFLPVGRSQFRPLASLTTVCALVSLASNYILMSRIGVIGAPIGVAIGETINVCGLFALSMREIRVRPDPDVVTQARVEAV
jgi:O-antigen/teichoic acid export membrane protein